jgi:hypothetical protein
VHTIRDPNRIAIMHPDSPLSYVVWKYRLPFFDLGDIFFPKTAMAHCPITDPSANSGY